MISDVLSRRRLLQGAVATAALVPLTSSHARRAPLPGVGAGASVAFIDLLSRAERADVLSGSNSIDITRKLTAAIAALPPGATLDARALHNVVRLSADPFAGAAARPATLLTGAVTFRKDFNPGPLILPSHFTWRGEGTRVSPMKPIAGILADSSPGVGMVSTALSPGFCSGRQGSSDLEIDHPVYAAAIVPGCRLAIFGIEPDPELVARIANRIDRETSSFGFAESIVDTIEGSLAYLMIDREIMLGRIVKSVFRSEPPKGRGAHGTIAAAHASGAPARVFRSAIFTVVSVTGQTVRLDRPLPRSFAAAPFRAGSVDSRLTGNFVIDGEYDRGRGGGFFNCLASTLGAGFVADGEISLRRGMHSGFFGYGCDQARITLLEISGCGRPADDLGASIILFGRVSRSIVKVGRVTDSTIGYAIDNKSFGVTYYGLDGPCSQNVIEIDRLDSHRVEGQISGSSGNRVTIADAETTVGSVIVDSGIRQSGARVPTADNVIITLRQRPPRPPLGDALAGNRFTMPGSVP